MSSNIILKILAGQANEKEKTDFFTNCEKNTEMKEEFIRLKNLWALSVDEKSSDKNKRFEEYWKQIRRQRSGGIRKIAFGVGKYAAIVIIAFGLAYWVRPKVNTGSEQLLQTFTSEPGSVSSIELSDGSKIWLNSGSVLNFTEKSSKRVVAKLSGEAYFEIKHDPDREFLVDVDKIRIRDIGTEFNIRAYPGDENISASLKNGKIGILSPANNPLVEMKPNDHFVLKRSTNKYTVWKTDPQFIAGWKDGKFVFIDKSLREMCDELEKWYGVKIFIQNNLLESGKYTSILKRTTTIKHMLEMLKITTGINYKIENKDGYDTIIIK